MQASESTIQECANVRRSPVPSCPIAHWISRDFRPFWHSKKGQTPCALQTQRQTRLSHAACARLPGPCPSPPSPGLQCCKWSSLEHRSTVQRPGNHGEIMVKSWEIMENHGKSWKIMGNHGNHRPRDFAEMVDMEFHQLKYGSFHGF